MSCVSSEGFKCVSWERTKDVRNRKRICEREEKEEKSVRLKLSGDESWSLPHLLFSVYLSIHNLHFTAVHSDCWKVQDINHLSELRACEMISVSVWSPCNVVAEETAEMLSWGALLRVLSVVFLQRLELEIFTQCLEYLECSLITEPSVSFRTFHTHFHCFTHIYKKNEL